MTADTKHSEEHSDNSLSSTQKTKKTFAILGSIAFWVFLAFVATLVFFFVYLTFFRENEDTKETGRAERASASTQAVQSEQSRDPLPVWITVQAPARSTADCNAAEAWVELSAKGQTLCSEDTPFMEVCYKDPSSGTWSTASPANGEGKRIRIRSKGKARPYRHFLSPNRTCRPMPEE